jgi:mycofactocin precursor
MKRSGTAIDQAISAAMSLVPTLEFVRALMVCCGYDVEPRKERGAAMPTTSELTSSMSPTNVIPTNEQTTEDTSTEEILEEPVEEELEEMEEELIIEDFTIDGICGVY